MYAFYDIAHLMLCWWMLMDCILHFAFFDFFEKFYLNFHPFQLLFLLSSTPSFSFLYSFLFFATIPFFSPFFLFLFFLFFSLSGTIPSALGSLERVQTLILKYNFLVGKIPTNFGNLKKITLLDLSFNALTGKKYFIHSHIFLKYSCVAEFFFGLLDNIATQLFLLFFLLSFVFLPSFLSFFLSFFPSIFIYIFVYSFIHSISILSPDPLPYLSFHSAPSRSSPSCYTTKTLNKNINPSSIFSSLYPN